MRTRRTVLGAVGAAIARTAGCLGPSGSDSDNGNGDGNGSEGPPGEVVVGDALSDSLSVERSARFEDATIDEELIVEGTVANNGEETVSVSLTLNIEDFRRNDDQTVEIGAGESADFSVSLTGVYQPQFDGYTLNVAPADG